MNQTTKLSAFDDELARAVRTLARRDPEIRGLIKTHGPPTFRPHKDYFPTLVHAVISQQISGSAAESIRRKLLDVLGGAFDPRLLLELPDETIRGAGISPQKLGYLRSLAEHVVDKRLDFKKIVRLEDHEVVEALTAVKGIGIWTAQMFLIFSLGRLDVLPVGDLGVQRGIQKCYALADLPRPAHVAEIAEGRRWAPYRSVAAWYMWRAS